jgi:SAM-dependent methyltransferase
VERGTWLRDRRQTAEERYDAIWAFAYDDEYGEIGPTHRRFVAAVVERCPPGGTVLDAACGTGKYFSMVLAAGRRVVGTDQSSGMLARTRAKFPGVPTEKVGLQELSFQGEFDAVLCVDAMEFVPPEDWPRVLRNLRRAMRPGGHLYLTVELADEQALARSFAEATERGLPVVSGEMVEADAYHYYPPSEQVATWVGEAGLVVVEEDRSPGDGFDGYQHLLLRAARGPAVPS